MNKSDFNYYIPQELIAQDPIEKRDMSRLMVLDRRSGRTEEGIFRDILKYLRKGDCLVMNDTRVIPARLYGKKCGTGAKIEFVLLHPVAEDTWNVILKPGRRAKPGAEFVFGDGLLRAKILEIADEGNRIVKFVYDGIFNEILDKVGIIPLPPYITHELKDKERYQTVYNRDPGSAAAPTAGLHFTGELLAEARAMGIRTAYVTLHVGTGTFRPVKENDITKHKMHAESYQITAEAADTINAARADGGRIVAVGTTSCRVLETAASAAPDGKIRECGGETDIFIYPGYRFKAVDAMITNFHLPESTLIMLVSALAGRENVLAAYNEAVEKRFRFFSFGDAMLII